MTAKRAAPKDAAPKDMAPGPDPSPPPREADAVVCAVAMGSNMGDRLVFLRSAMARIVSLEEATLLGVSSVYESEPESASDGLPFYNAVCILSTSLTPGRLLERLRNIERELGRPEAPARSGEGPARKRTGPRTIDLDLVLHGDTVSDDPECTLPHPRLLSRNFVLLPLAEIAPKIVIPPGGLDAGRAAVMVDSSSINRIAGPGALL